MPSTRLFLALASVPWLLGCSASTPETVARAGHLLIIGGGLDNDARPVFERLLELAAEPAEPRVLIATAATGDQEVEVIDKTEALRAWAPDVPVEVIRRETPTAEAVAAIERATAILFTGGDQSRITARYRPEGEDTPEAAAMRRLLARGGVIAGCSAGDAMMGRVMLVGGGSAGALAEGPRLAPGMAFLPWALTDSHFFERDRVGRLVAALEESGCRLGLGVGEDAAVEVDLGRGILIGITPSETLLVDAGSLSRDVRARRRLKGRLIHQGDRVPLRDRGTAPSPPPRPDAPTHTMSVVEPGQNRQLASWRVFKTASHPGSGIWAIDFDAWRLEAWPASDGEVWFDVLSTRD